MIKGFQFEEGGRTYKCTIEERTAEPLGTWWWFTASPDQQRYAPFQATSHDTQQSVKTRIVAYYENLLRVRSEPAAPRYGAGRPAGSGAHKGGPGNGKPPMAAGKPAAPPPPPQAKAAAAKVPAGKASRTGR